MNIVILGISNTYNDNSIQLQLQLKVVLQISQEYVILLVILSAIEFSSLFEVSFDIIWRYKQFWPQLHWSPFFTFLQGLGCLWGQTVLLQNLVLRYSSQVSGLWSKLQLFLNLQNPRLKWRHFLVFRRTSWSKRFKLNSFDFVASPWSRICWISSGFSWRFVLAASISFSIFSIRVFLLSWKHFSFTFRSSLFIRREET